MKRSLVLSAMALFLVLFVSLASGQTTIPNGGFENWTGGNPDNWVTSNAPPAYTNVTKVSGRTGSAARGEVVSLSPAAPIPMPPLMQSGVGGGGFTYTQRPGFLTGYYQFSPASGSNNRIVITVLLTKGGLSAKSIAVGGAPIATAASSWQQFSVPLVYTAPDAPDTCYIQFTLAGSATGGSATIGSYFLLDDLAFTGTASAVGDEVGLPSSFALEQNYPNPFNPSTNIRFSVAQAGHVSLKVYNVLGVEVASLVNEQKEMGTFNVNWNAAGFPSGMYLYRLSVTSEKGQVFEQSKKLVLLK